MKIRVKERFLLFCAQLLDTGRVLAEHKGEAMEAKRDHKENKDVIKQLKEELRLQQVIIL